MNEAEKMTEDMTGLFRRIDELRKLNDELASKNGALLEQLRRIRDAVDFVGRFDD